ncbi:hypothetical protein [Glacieibacterium frigidum]|uniref:DUF2157 domain-containing protein n=1 Tax=Glacieibacterium frigidum TaxID=2593303 RepID=A0A552UGW5_9SPHN|nr:hypothetical protein [Glacieibacterium frigidum]TRW17468.1 hypothetical protein FMM06_04705 [Glacieibacterium frigidum]
MIDERDLDAAVTSGVLDPAQRERLVQFASDHRRGEAGPDEEQFRLLTGFNDIFVTIAVGLVLFAVGALGGLVSPVLGAALVAGASWGLAEYFTRQRRMALPSIVLLLSFVASVMTVLGLLLGGESWRERIDAAPLAFIWSLIAIGGGGAAAAWLHWRRFMVPITVAAGAASLVLLVIGGGALVLEASGFKAMSPLPWLILVCGLAVFALAMWADARDRARVTRWSDVAFWLHLLAAPLIVHPVFSLAGLMDASPAPSAAVAVIAVYALLTIVALAIDRRALLVSALGYVIYAIQALIGRGGEFSASFGVTALLIGAFLVMLSAGWRPIRSRVIALLPAGVAGRLPAAA